jgi:hypothetical protein
MPRQVVWAMVLGGSFLFLTTGAALALYCFSGDGKAHKPARRLVGDISPRDLPGGQTAGGQPLSSAPHRAAQAPVGQAKTVQPPALRLSLPEAEQVKVNQAIANGVKYLKSSQTAQGPWPGNLPVGYTALPGLTLLECGVPATDPAIRKAAAFVRKAWPRLNTTYELSLTILFLDRLDDSADEPLIRTLALRLIAGQTLAGGWSYHCPVLTSQNQQKLYKLLRDIPYESALDLEKPLPDKLRQDASRSLPKGLSQLPVLQDPPEIDADVYRQGIDDNSNTQFAVLALWAMRRHHVPLERALALIDRRFRATQDENGSWWYKPQGNVSPLPTMTCAGLLGLAVGHGLAADNPKAKGQPTKDPAIRRGLRVVGENIGRPTSSDQYVPLANLYFLWSVERVGMLYNLRKIGDKDWYAWAAPMLVANQRTNGSWQGGGYPGSTPTIDTCFALLVLKRANLAKDLTAKLVSPLARD